jgi:hypothetical protein
MATASVSAFPALRVERRELRQWLRTTPGRLRVLSGIVVALVAAFGVVAVAATTARIDTVRALSAEHERSLENASHAYVALSDGDAIAADAFLSGGAEPSGPRAQYEGDLTTASERLASLAAGLSASPGETQALRTIDDRIPRYTGLVELARANNREGFPVGAAYLREASTLMREQILPSLLSLYHVEAGQLDHSYRSALSGTVIAIVVGAGLAAVAGIAFVQLVVWRRSRRVFNVGLLLATALILMTGTYTVGSLVVQQHHLESARVHGSDEVVVLSSAQILALRARGDEGLALSARGGSDSTQYFRDFHQVEEHLASTQGANGLLFDAQHLTASTPASRSVNELMQAFRSYTSADDQVEASASSGDTEAAISQATTGSDQLAFSDLNTRFIDATGDANARFVEQASDAQAALRRTRLVLVGGALVAAGCVLFGLRPRIREFR